MWGKVAVGGQKVCGIQNATQQKQQRKLKETAAKSLLKINSNENEFIKGDLVFANLGQLGCHYFVFVLF